MTLAPPAIEPVAPPQPLAVRIKSRDVQIGSIRGSAVGSGVAGGGGVASSHGTAASGGDASSALVARREAGGALLGSAVNGPTTVATMARTATAHAAVARRPATGHRP